MIYRSQFEQFLNQIQDDIDERDDGHWPLPEFAPEILAWLRQHGVTIVEDNKPACPYTFSHTRHWCGHSTCRES